MVKLADQPPTARAGALDHPHLPQRPAAVKRLGHHASDQSPQLRRVAGVWQCGVAQVVGQLEVRILHPHRPAEPPRHPRFMALTASATARSSLSSVRSARTTLLASLCSLSANRLRKRCWGRGSSTINRAGVCPRDRRTTRFVAATLDDVDTGLGVSVAATASAMATVMPRAPYQAVAQARVTSSLISKRVNSV